MLGLASLASASEATPRWQDTFATASSLQAAMESDAPIFPATPFPLARSPSLSGIPLTALHRPSPPLPHVFTKKDLLLQGCKHRLTPRGSDPTSYPAISSLWGPRGHTLCASRFDRGTFAKLRLGRRDGHDVAIREVAVRLEPTSSSTLSSYDSSNSDYFHFSGSHEESTQALTLLERELDEARKSQTIAKVDFDQFLKELNAQRLIEPAMKIYDVFYARGRLFTVTELFAGSSDQLARFAAGETLRGTSLLLFLGRLMVRDISYALLRALSHNLGHHDVSSRNILWDHDGAFYLADYGLVEQLSPRVPMQWTSSSLAAPEHFYPFRKRNDPLYYDERLDVWALGVSWLQMISREAAEIFYQFRTLGEEARHAELRLREAVDAWQSLESEPYSKQILRLPASQYTQLHQTLWTSKKALQDAIVDVKHLRRAYRQFLNEVRVNGKIEPKLIGRSHEPRPFFDFHTSLKEAASLDPYALAFVLDNMLALDPTGRAPTFDVASFFSDIAPLPNSVLFRDVQRMVNKLYCDCVLPSRAPSLQLLQQTESMLPDCYTEYGLAPSI